LRGKNTKKSIITKQNGGDCKKSVTNGNGGDRTQMTRMKQIYADFFLSSAQIRTIRVICVPKNRYVIYFACLSEAVSRK